MEGAIAHILESDVVRTSDVATGSVSFEDLNIKDFILSGLRAHKFQTPTKIQAAAIPMALCGMNLLVQSKSGTGKTLIYVIAALHKWIKIVRKPQVLIFVPTRELAIQVEDTVNGLCNFPHERKNICVSFIGGTDVKKDRMRINMGRIIVGTPGRLLHLVHNKVLDTSAIKLIVLDEADQLYATESLQQDINTLVSPLLSRSQVIACSATYPNALDERLAKLMSQPILVSNSERATVLLGVRQFVYELPKQVNNLQDMAAKLAALHNIFAQVPYEQAILFASSQIRADSFCNYLRRANIECELMSGALNQAKRLETFQAYRNFKMRTMVATDLMARGVDSSHANLIINLDPPADIITYLHRIGRAGRFGSKGIAITFISSPEQCQKFKHMIADFGTGTSVLQFPTNKRDGFSFWDYDSYDFPYFHKTEGHEQGEDELQRIKKRWNTAASTEQAHVSHEVAKDEIIHDTKSNETSHMKPKDKPIETESLAKVVLPLQDDKAKANDSCDIREMQLSAALKLIKSLEHQRELVKSDAPSVKHKLQIKTNNLAEEQQKMTEEQSKPETFVSKKNELEENQPGVVKNELHVVPIEEQQKMIEEQPQHEPIVFEKDNLEKNQPEVVKQEGKKVAPEEQPRLIEEQHKPEPLVSEKEYLEHNQPGVAKMEGHVVEPEVDCKKENLAEEQSKLIEEQHMSKALVAERDNLENLIEEDQNIIKNESNSLSESNIVDDKKSLSDNEQENPNDIKSINSNQTQPYPSSKAPELYYIAKSAIDLIETPSTEMPVAAPNSINTRTYCLAAPTELSSTTLHPQALSNTVDDASSIISDSMDNEYDSDASYSTFYSESDARLIYCHALVQRKLKKRLERLNNRPVYIFNWRGCSPVSWNSQTVKKTKSYIHDIEVTQVKNEDQKNAERQKSEEDISYKKQRRKRSSRNKKLCENEFNINIPNCNLFSVKKNSALRVLEKFDNVSQIQKRLSTFMMKKRLSSLKLGDWINQLYNSTLCLYYNKPKKPRKIALPKVSNLDRYNSIMAFLKGPEHARETAEEYPQNKFSVHVNPSLNILPINVEVENIDDEDAHSNASETASSYLESDNESDDVGSLDPYSSSGFVDSAESASSGIDTSQNGSHSLENLDSNEYTDGDDEAESLDNHTVTDSINTLTAESEDESEVEDEESDTDEDGQENNFDQRLAMAQDRWQYLFHMQYQYIANYVENYLKVCNRQQ